MSIEKDTTTATDPLISKKEDGTLVGNQSLVDALLTAEGVTKEEAATHRTRDWLKII